jgi:hypothetical protein
VDPTKLIEAAAEATPLIERRFPRIRRVLAWARASAVMLLVTGAGVGVFVAAAWLFIHAWHGWGIHELLPAVQSAAAVPPTDG